MGGCRQIIAGILGVVFVITAVLALLVVNVTYILTDREAVKEALGLEAILRETLPDLVDNAIAEQLVLPASLPVDLDTKTISQTLLDALPPDLLDEVTETAVDGMFAYLLTGNETTAVISLDLNPLLAELEGETGRQLVQQYLESLPVCTEAQLLTLLNGAIPRCKPPGIPLAELSQQVHAIAAPLLLSQISIGDHGVVDIPLAALFSANPDAMRIVQRIRLFYAWAPQVWLLWLPPLACLLLILALAVRSWGSLGGWWGWPLAAAGAAGLVFSFMIPGLALGWLRTAVFSPPAGANTPGAIWQPLLQQGVVQLSEMWAGRLGWQAGVLLVLGCIFLVFGFLAKKISQGSAS